jgi:hypothetical protein
MKASDMNWSLATVLTYVIGMTVLLGFIFLPNAPLSYFVCWSAVILIGILVIFRLRNEINEVGDRIFKINEPVLKPE